MKTSFGENLQAMLQSLYRNGTANADFLPVPDGLESYSADAIRDTFNMGHYADPHPLQPGLVKDALHMLKVRAAAGAVALNPLEQLGAELLRVMAGTADWDADIPKVPEPGIQPILVESRFSGTFEETFTFEESFEAFSRGLRVRLSAKYRAHPEKLEVVRKEDLYSGSALNQVKVLFRVTFTLFRELDFPGPPVPVFAKVWHGDVSGQAVERKVLEVQHLPVS